MGISLGDCIAHNKNRGTIKKTAEPECAAKEASVSEDHQVDLMFDSIQCDASLSDEILVLDAPSAFNHKWRPGV